jgi:nucleotide-binding universal stress UspA family protein
MQTIITPTDFSGISLNAVNYATDMALALNAKLLVLHATELPINVGTEPEDDEIEIKLDTLKKNILKRTGNKIPVQSKQVTGLIENEIIKMCDYVNPLAVVMATHGATLIEKFFIGSITVYLSKNLTCPVIIVPESISFKPAKKILLASDLEKLYDMPIEKIINTVNTFKATLDIVHVYNSEEKFEAMSARISQLANYLKPVNPQFHFIKNENVFSAVLNFAKENNSDLILTMPRKHAFFYRSNSKQFIFNSPLAVMTMQ